MTTGSPRATFPPAWPGPTWRRSTSRTSIRHQLLVQLAWADRLENDRIITLLDSYAEKLRTRLDLYHGESQRSQLDRARSEREHYLWQLILDNGIGLYERELEWAERAIAGLRGYADR